MSSANSMKDITAQVRNATQEQSVGGKSISGAAENITGMVYDISRACAEQSHGSEIISESVENIQASAAINLDATKTLDESVVSLSKQIESLRKEMSAFKV